MSVSLHPHRSVVVSNNNNNSRRRRMMLLLQDRDPSVVHQMITR